MARFLINRITLIKLYPQNFILKRSRIVRSTKYLSAAAATGGFFTLREKKNKSRKDAKPQRPPADRRETRTERRETRGKKRETRKKRQRAVRFLCGSASLREKKNPRNAAGQASAADPQFCGAERERAKPFP